MQTPSMYAFDFKGVVDVQGSGMDHEEATEIAIEAGAEEVDTFVDDEENEMFRVSKYEHDFFFQIIF